MSKMWSLLLALAMVIACVGCNPAEKQENAGAQTKKLKVKVPNDFSVPINKYLAEMVLVEPGSFVRDSNKVTISSAYLIGRTEVTQKVWKSIMGNNPSKFQGDMGLPVEMISYDEAIEFCAKVNQILEQNGWYEGYAATLPTEAMWEFAARGGNQSNNYEYSGSDSCAEVAVFGCDAPEVVGSRAPNELGIYDMSGNVWEWCYDWYADYPEQDVIDPIGPESGSIRVCRGGSWSSSAGSCRSANRYAPSPRYSFVPPNSDYDGVIGFRLALVPVQ